MLAVLVTLTGCMAERERRVSPPPESEVDIRAYQSRTFDGAGEHEVMRIVLATLQDLDYQIERVNPELGIVGGVRRRQRITVTVNPRGDNRVVVRASLQSRRGTSHDRLEYQRFFAALEKSQFLRENHVD
jgi:hypothetical protein